MLLLLTFFLIANALTVNALLATNITGYWKNDIGSGTTSPDAYGNNTMLLINGTTWSVSGKINNVTDFDGANDILADMAINNTMFKSLGSVSFWTYLDTIPATNDAFFGLHGAGGTQRFALYSKAGTGTYALLGPGAGDLFTANAGAIPIGGWHHVVVTWDFTTDQYRIYVDTVNQTGSTTTDAAPSPSQFYIGGMYAVSSSIDGRVDEFGFWDKILSATEISDLYNNGTGYQYPFNFTIKAQDIFTNASIYGFNASLDGTFYTTTDGQIETNINNSYGGTHNITINATSAMYVARSYTSQIVSSNFVGALYSIYRINMSLLNESDVSTFNVSGKTLTFRAFCTNETVERSVTTNPFNASFNCEWDYMRMYVTIGNDTYYRTLKPTYPQNSSNGDVITWYLIDLASDTSVQKIFYLSDLDGTYDQGDLIVEKIIGSNQVTINRQQWDIEKKVQLYLILYDTYIITLTDNLNVTKVLGYFLADTSASHTVQPTSITFAPTQTIDDFQFQYLPDLENGWLYMAYQTENNTLYNVTWLIVNASNTSQVFLNTSFNTTTGSANFTSIKNGTGYLTTLTFNSSSYSIHSDIKRWGSLLIDGLNDAFSFFDNPGGAKLWFGFILIVAGALGFSYFTMGLAAIWSAGMTTFFWWIGFFVFGYYSLYILAFIWIVATMTFLIAEGVK